MIHVESVEPARIFRTRRLTRDPPEAVACAAYVTPIVIGLKKKYSSSNTLPARHRIPPEAVDLNNYLCGRLWTCVSLKEYP